MKILNEGKPEGNTEAEKKDTNLEIFNHEILLLEAHGVLKYLKKHIWTVKPPNVSVAWNTLPLHKYFVHTRDFFSREQAKSEWVVMSSVFVASQCLSGQVATFILTSVRWTAKISTKSGRTSLYNGILMDIKVTLQILPADYRVIDDILKIYNRYIRKRFLDSLERTAK